MSEKDKILLEIEDQKDWSDIQFIETKKKDKSPYIRIFRNKYMKIYFSPAFLESVKEQYVNLGISSKNKAIIMFFHDDENDTGIRKIKRTGKGFTLSAQTIFNELMIDEESCLGNFSPQYEQICQDVYAWVIYLDKKISE